MMSYQDEYYKRTPQQEHAIYKDRERTWNVIRFFVLFFPFLGAMAMLDHWSRNIVEPVVSNVTAPASDQAVVGLDVSCLYLPALIMVLFLGAAMLRAIGRSHRDVRESKPRRVTREAEPQSEEFPQARLAKRPAAQEATSTLADDYIKEIQARKDRLRTRAAKRAQQRAEALAQEERVRAAQSERLIANATASLRESMEDRIAMEKRREEQWKS